MNSIAPGFASHLAEYAYFFGFPSDYDTGNMNPTVPNVTSHLALSRGIVDKLIAYIATGDPNDFQGEFSDYNGPRTPPACPGEADLVVFATPKVPNFPERPLYTAEEPKNIVFNATEEDNNLNVHVEHDTWRKKGMDLWKKYPYELRFGSK